jgi:beta-aspartyl-peptidase (threonine type)
MADKQPVAIVIHGGAGTIIKEKMSASVQAEYRQVLTDSVKAGYKVLQDGGESAQAVIAAITIMEDSPLFNAGKGSVFTHDGKNEMDASIMEGNHLEAGSVAGVSRVKNPIQLAYRIMVNSPHVILAGKGAERFAEQQQMGLVDPSYFYTERRWQQLQNLLQEEAQSGTKGDQHPDDRNNHITSLSEDAGDGFDDHKFGTVGAVALDKNGHIAAGTSTGGMTNKRFGRVGDSPIIGAGTYADDDSCGISATGHGEYFIRAAVAHDICARARYKGISLQQGADEVIMDKLVKMKGEGGIIGIDPQGNVVFSFNSEGMYRAAIDAAGTLTVAIFK